MGDEKAPTPINSDKSRAGREQGVQAPIPMNRDSEAGSREAPNFNLDALSFQVTKDWQTKVERSWNEGENALNTRKILKDAELGLRLFKSI
jgi:hypothetical protein